MAMTKKELEKELAELKKEVHSLQDKLSSATAKVDIAKKVLS